jgi:hypothetical protein
MPASPTLLVLFLAFFFSLAAAVETPRQVDVFAWPLSAAKPRAFATIAYTSTNASIKSYTSPTLPSDDDIVRIGFFHKSGSWSGVATSASNLAAEKQKKVQLHVRPDGELYHLAFKTAAPVSQGKGKNSKKDLNVEVVKIKPGPVPVLNKPVVVREDGQVEGKEPEKTFLQKYAWITLARSKGLKY